MEKQEPARLRMARSSQNKGAGAADPEVARPLRNKMTLFELPHDQRGCYV